MWIIKWVEMNNVFEYHPKVLFAETYDEAREIKCTIEEKFDKLNDEQDKDEHDKIVSEVSIEEINKVQEKTRLKDMQPDELLFCNKCNKPANMVVAQTAIGIELVWNNKDSIYEVAEEKYDIKDSTSVFCAGCMSDLLKQ